MGCHLQAVYLNECGVYPHVLPAIRKYIESLGYDVRELDEEYAAFQTRMRELTGARVKAGQVAIDEPSNGAHPFLAFRKMLGMSRMSFSKSFAVHPAFLYKLERAEAHGLSSQMKNAMAEAGFRPSVIDELDYRCAEYADFHRSLGTAS